MTSEPPSTPTSSVTSSTASSPTPHRDEPGAHVDEDLDLDELGPGAEGEADGGATLFAEGASPPHLPMLWQDETFIIVNKPSGLAVHQGWARERHTVVSCLRSQLGEHWSPVHRLDRATSGALLLARDAETTRRLQAQFDAGSVIKNYLALVRGIAPESGLIDHAIAKSKQHEKRPAQTAFRRVGTFERYSIVLARPLTGRLHQIRRHLKFISHPLIGDTKYGKGEHNRLFRARFGLHRMALHASHLQLSHPYSGVPISAVAAIPDDLAVIGHMGLTNAVAGSLAQAAWAPDVTALRVFTD